jgi:uncharacterized protein YgiM (DUF1202 family)
VAAFLVAASIACSLVSPTPPTPTFVPLPTATALPAPTETPPPQPADKPTPTEAPPVTLSASGGNLNMRRGPGTGYNIMAVLRTGESGTATARSEDSDWLLMEIASQPGTSAWVSAASQYANVQGDASTLPVILVEPPVPAYLRNCLFHPVLIQPGDVLLPNQTSAPNNTRQFNPGIYEGFDQNVEMYPKVFSVELREGKTVDITTDGLNMHYSCP